MTATSSPDAAAETPRVTVERDGHTLLIGLNRADQPNAADVAMLEQLALAYGELDRDPELRVGVVFAHGDHFTGGLDLADVAPRIGPKGLAMVPEGGIHPWGMDGSRVRKPVVLAVQGTCLTLGIELALGELSTQTWVQDLPNEVNKRYVADYLKKHGRYQQDVY